MFKFKSYNVKKASEKNEKQQPSSSTATLKKPSSKEKKKALGRVFGKLRRVFQRVGRVF